jgi:hypothetical protein
MITTADATRPAVTADVPQAQLPQAPAPTLAEALQAIRQDCVVEPQVYLDEVRVPFGGE